MPQQVERTDDIVQVNALAWIDIQRTKELLFDVYHAETAARERPFGWPDRPSESLLTLYAIVYGAFAQVLSSQVGQTGDAVADSTTAELARQADNLARRMFDNTSFR